MKSDDAFDGITTIIVLALVLAFPLFMGFAVVIPIALITVTGLLIYASRIK